MRGALRSAAGTARNLKSALTTGHWLPDWSRVADNPAVPDPIDDAPLFAIVGTYNEGDVIEATVRNALAQGAERVYLVDNASTDDTVARAQAAGAVLADSYETAEMEDRVRIMLMNAALWRISTAENRAHIWWLWVDADEFPHGPGNQTLAQYLGGLDRRFRVVGSDFYQHYPDAKPEYLSGFHPLDFQPLCERFHQPLMPRCRLRHYKHPLARYDRAGPFLFPPNSFHTWEADDRVPLVEPRHGIVTHHFQFRQESVTRARLDAVYGPAGGRGAQMLRRGSPGGNGRLASADAVYARDWQRVDNDRYIPGDRGVQLAAWDELVPGSEPARWYGPEELAEARRRAAAG